MGRLDRWVEYAEEGRRTCVLKGNRWIRSGTDGNRFEDQTAWFVCALNSYFTPFADQMHLDLSGEMVQIPSGLVAGPPPSNTDFFFSDLM